MPKSAKKRKDKAADFAKTKLKLGKKQVANNAIDTSFKARSIALPSQSIAAEKDIDALTTKRKLTLDDLVAHTKHYSPGTRKDAILGLRELLDAHWQIIDGSLAILINATVRMIPDEDASVRKTVLAFFAWLFQRVPREDVVPHAPLLLLFATSAQTHIFPEIRIDAIRFLNLFLEYIPDATVSGWDEENEGHGSRIMKGYLGILNAGTRFGDNDGPLAATSTASVVITPASKLVVLQSLSLFLKRALSLPYESPHNPEPVSATMPVHSWYLARSFLSPEAYESFEGYLQPSSQTQQGSSSCHMWKSEVEFEDEDFVTFGLPTCSYWDLQSLSEVTKVSGGHADAHTYQKGDPSIVAHLARTLNSTLISTFLDCAPTVFSPAGRPPETELHLIIAVSEIASSLYGVILRDTTSISGTQQKAIEDLRSILGYMTTFFPFRANGKRDVKIEQAFQDLNLIYCELTSLLILASQTDSSSHSRNKNTQSKARVAAKQSKDKLDIQAELVSDYVLQVLSGGEVSASQLPRSLTTGSYISLLPTVWALINYPGHNEKSSEVLRATLDHAVQASSKSALKKSTVEFVAKLILVSSESQYTGNFRSGRQEDEDQAFESWIVHLPRVLWELGSNNLLATEMILRFLLRLLQRKHHLLHPKTVSSLKSRLVPYFSITHAVRGQMLGPYGKLPMSTSQASCPSRSQPRRLALDVVVTLLTASSPDKSDSSDGELSAAVALAVRDTEEEKYWAQLRQLIPS